MDVRASVEASDILRKKDVAKKTIREHMLHLIYEKTKIVFSCRMIENEQ